MTTNNESIQAGKATIHRTAGGTVWFLDKNGHKVTLNDPREASRLFEAIREGSGEPVTVTHVEGTEPPRNLNDGRLGNETRTYGTGGNWLYPHGNWNE
ncbi:MAG: hypothetical protein FD119_3729 [Stygiobacter sp.]|nr:MAG: hypothetical protein FD119_3729 [Stygiobacter sp.]